MYRLSPAPFAILAFLVASFVTPALAGAEETPAATVAPVLETPAVGAANFTEGGSMTFEWRGSLQGDEDALERSSFRLEVIKSSELPSGSQTAWPDAELFAQTTAGQNETSAQVGVPDAGDYRWRVCAWGVVDDVVDNTIQQIPGGCSSSRAFTTIAATIKSSTIGELKMQTKVQQEGEVKKVFVTKETDTTESTPAPTTTTNPVTKVAKEILKPAIFQRVTRENTTRGGGSSVTFGSDKAAIPGDLDSEATADKERTVGGRVASGLTTTLPGVPIPFWTLALLLATVPIARAWRRSVLGMFDWADGSVDGSGTFDDPIDDLRNVQDAPVLKPAPINADGSAPGLTSDSAPDRRRRAA
ncbi:MAG: hypothetical protein JWM86_2187 [Thermoleophilia bacterium]|nr:hypothetical protein [Thermoleophilia bacterium]